MTLMNHKYAIYPGSVTLYNGTVRTFTAAQLAEAFGVQTEPYLVVNNPTEIPKDMAYFEYIHLKPRRDNNYPAYKVVAQDDDQVITWEEDFDSSKKYTMETEHPYSEDSDN